MEVLWRSLYSVLENHCSWCPWPKNGQLWCLVCWWRRKIKLLVLNTLDARTSTQVVQIVLMPHITAHWPKPIPEFKYQKMKYGQSIPNRYDKNCNFMTFLVNEKLQDCIIRHTFLQRTGIPKSMDELTAWTKRPGIHCKHALSWEWRTTGMLVVSVRYLWCSSGMFRKSLVYASFLGAQLSVSLVCCLILSIIWWSG